MDKKNYYKHLVVVDTTSQIINTYKVSDVCKVTEENIGKIVPTGHSFAWFISDDEPDVFDHDGVILDL